MKAFIYPNVASIDEFRNWNLDIKSSCDLTLPERGTAGSLGLNHQITVDTNCTIGHLYGSLHLKVCRLAAILTQLVLEAAYF